MNEPIHNSHPLLPRRLAAMVYDTLLVLPIIMAGVALATGIQVWLSGSAGPEVNQAELHPQLVQLITLLSVVGFFSWFWLRGGQTLGMQAWRIKLVNFEGGPD